MRRASSLLVGAGLCAAALVIAAPGAPAADAVRVAAGGRATGAHRPGDAVGRLPRARTAVGCAGHAGQRPHRAVPGPGDPGLLRHGRQRRRHVPRACRTTGSAPRPTRPTSSCGSTTSASTGRPPRGGAGAISVGDHVSLADPDGSARLPDRQRRHARAAADRRRLRHRVGRTRRRRHAVDRRGVRPVPAPLRRRPASCSRRRSQFPDGKSPAQPVPPAGRDRRGCAAAAASRRWPRRPTAGTLYPIVEGSFTDDPPAAPPLHLRVRHRDRELHRPHLAVRDRPRRQRDRRRVHVRPQPDRADRARRLPGPGRGRPSASTRSTCAAPTATATSRRSSSPTCCASPTPTRIGTDTSPGAYGVGDPFAFAGQSVEVVLPLGGDRLLVGLDNNYPGGSSRYPGTPDDTELITIDFQKVRDDAPRHADHRPPRRQRLPARAHAGRLRDGDPAVRRLHRARPRVDQGRRARRPPRERDRRHDRRRRPSRVRRPPDDEDDRRRRRSPAGSPRTSRSPS